MKHRALLCVIVLFSLADIYSQEYFEASGQTSVFTLRAGEKSMSSSVALPAQKAMSGTMSVQFKANKLVVNFSNINAVSAEVHIFNMQGRTVEKIKGVTGPVYVKNLSELTPGFYSVIVKASGARHYHRFLVAR